MDLTRVVRITSLRGFIVREKSKELDVQSRCA
jgi:hypothetical protein